MLDLCKFVDVFHGCGEIDLPKAEGIAAKWFFLKAGCGNTTPAATMPFGGMSVAPYSGGYPTGYGSHLPNSHSRPAKFSDGNKLLGFAHLQQSGTGAIEYYYNYAVTTPKYESSEERRSPIDEKGVPGYYSCFLEDIKCELTCTQRTALHRYTFGQENGIVEIDFTNNGLRLPGHERRKVYDLKIEKPDHSTVTASAVIEGINIYFAAECNGELETTDTKAIYRLGNEKNAELKLAVSLSSTGNAVNFLQNASDFDTEKNNAYSAWNNELNKISITTDDEKTKRIFYSNLYHSFVKPADMSSESFIYQNGKPFITDLATLWDMYKTQLPLVFMTNKDIGEKLVETLLSTGEELGYVPNSIGLCDKFKMHDVQARMLGDYALLTAYRYGVKIDVKRMLNVIRNDIFADNKKDFTVFHRCKSHTWTLDMADGCALTAQVAYENGETDIYNELIPLAETWKDVYDPNTGLLKNDSDYYEGTLYNYSFRQMLDMDERIKIAGGKEKFVKLLDDFFGYGKEDTVQPTDPFNYKPVEEGMKLGRFEGFNNESDTEAPFSYIYANRHDRTCEIVRSGMKYMFTDGKGALPGNNDTGALSSYYVFAAIGLFPVAGQDMFMISSPFVNSADIQLFNGNHLKITVKNCSNDNIYVSSVVFDGNIVENYMIKASELLKGGELIISMTNKI